MEYIHNSLGEGTESLEQFRGREILVHRCPVEVLDESSELTTICLDLTVIGRVIRFQHRGDRFGELISEVEGIIAQEERSDLERRLRDAFKPQPIRGISYIHSTNKYS